MNRPSEADIYDAVRLNSVELLQALVDDGADLHVNLSNELPLGNDVMSTDENGRIVFKDDIFAFRQSSSSATDMAAIHLAIIHCFRSHEATSFSASNALDVLRFLLYLGVSPKSTCKNLLMGVLPNEGSNGSKYVQLFVDSKGRTAKSLAERLLARARGDEQTKTMKEVVSMLHHPTSLPKKATPSSKFLLSSKYSDVTFVCSDDETELPAHKILLASASDYFDTHFSGPWGEQYAGGKWNIEYSSDIIKAVLTFVYTQDVPASTFASETFCQSLMKVAHEWKLPRLFHMAETKISRMVSSANLLTLIGEAELYEAKVLKRACVRYMKDNVKGLIVENPHLTSTLASGHPNLWSELSDELQPARKKPRHSLKTE